MLDLLLSARHFLFTELTNMLLVGIGQGRTTPRLLLNTAGIAGILVAIATSTVHRHCVWMRVVDTGDLNLSVKYFKIILRKGFRTAPGFIKRPKLFSVN